MPYQTRLTLTLLLAALTLLAPLPGANARTDLSGCTSYTSIVTAASNPTGGGGVYPSVIYYVPDTLEVCEDCGGAPGCDAEAPPAPSFLSADPASPSATATGGDEEGPVASGSGTSSSAVTVTLGPVTPVTPSVTPTGSAGAPPANGTGANGTGTGVGNGTAGPSGAPVDTTASGNVLGATTMAALALALAVAGFLL